MADADTERLKKILTETYRNQAKDKQVKDAMRKRIANKKRVKKHGPKSVDKVTRHNLKTPLSDEAKAAQTRDQTGAGSDKVMKPKKKKAVAEKKKTNVFGLGQAISNIRKMKYRNKK